MSFLLLNTVIGICEQLQLKQFDGAPPLPADIQSNPINVTVAYDRPYYYYMPTTDSYYNDTSKWNLTVPVSGIVNFTVPASAARRTISITVVTLSRLFGTLNCTDKVERSVKWLV